MCKLSFCPQQDKASRHSLSEKIYRSWFGIVEPAEETELERDRPAFLSAKWLSPVREYASMKLWDNGTSCCLTNFSQSFARTLWNEIDLSLRNLTIESPRTALMATMSLLGNPDKSSGNVELTAVSGPLDEASDMNDLFEQADGGGLAICCAAAATRCFSASCVEISGGVQGK